MSRRDRGRRALLPTLAESSPLRRIDPRAKLLLSVGVSLTVALPLERLAVALGLYVLLVAWARLLPAVARQTWRLKWMLLFLFVVDWLVVSLDLAAAVTLRVGMLAGSFTLFFATTTPGELRLALEWLRVPHRYAFSLTVAFQSVGFLDEEWRAIGEAQRSRGAWSPPTGWRELVGGVRDLVALAVPAVVMTTKRAWTITEAAHARGFDSPHRRPYRRLAMRWPDWLLLAVTGAAGAALVLWR